MSGDGLHLERDAGSLDGLAAGEERRLALVRAHRDAGEEVRGPPEDVELAFGEPDGSARALGEVGERRRSGRSGCG